MLHVLLEWIKAYVERFPTNSHTTIQKLILLIINMIIWLIIGSLSSLAAAFFVFAMTPAGPNRAEPALYTILTIFGGCTLWGLYVTYIALRKQ
jgi:hypothetical protein